MSTEIEQKPRLRHPSVYTIWHTTILKTILTEFSIRNMSRLNNHCASLNQQIKPFMFQSTTQVINWLLLPSSVNRNWIGSSENSNFAENLSARFSGWPSGDRFCRKKCGQNCEASLNLHTQTFIGHRAWRPTRDENTNSVGSRCDKLLLGFAVTTLH